MDNRTWWTPTVVGILWVLLGTLLFSIVFASGKMLPQVPVAQLMLLRLGTGFVVVFAIVVAQGGGALRPSGTHPAFHFLRTATGTTGAFCAIYAAANMPIADATAVSLTEGMFVVVLAVLLLKERVGAWHWLAAATCAFGAFVVVQGTRNGSSGIGIDPMAGMALLGALLMAAETIFLKILAMRERRLTTMLYVHGLATLFWAIPAWLLWQPLDIGTLGVCMALGLVGLAGQYSNLRGFRLADAAILGPIGYSWIIFAAALGVFAFGEVPGPATAVGATLIVAGGVALARLPQAAPRSCSDSKPAN